jgi:hypothetical protein
MTQDPSPKQTLLVWVLLFTGDEPKISTVKPGLSPRERTQMEEAGLIRLEKRGRTTHILLTDKAWGWAAAHLDAAFSSRSSASAPALAGLLKKLKAYLEAGDLALADFLRPLPPRPADVFASGELVEPVPPASKRPGPELEAAVIRAYLQASGSAWNVWVNLAEIRRRLPDVPRLELDRELLRLERAKRAVLYPIDDPQAIRPEDAAAALDIAGFKRHIVMMRG